MIRGSPGSIIPALLQNVKLNPARFGPVEVLSGLLGGFLCGCVGLPRHAKALLFSSKEWEKREHNGRINFCLTFDSDPGPASQHLFVAYPCG